MKVKDKLLLKAPDLAEELGVSLPTVYRILHSDDGPAYIRIGRSIRIPADSVKEWIETHKGGQVLG